MCESESICLIEVHYFSEKPKTQKVSQHDSVISLSASIKKLSCFSSVFIKYIFVSTNV